MTRTSRVIVGLGLGLALIWSGLGTWHIVHGQELPQAYILDHPIDPDLLIVATQDGRYPFALLAGPDCSWVHSDMNVMVDTEQHALWQLTDGSNVCYVAVGAQVDATPCLTNSAGDCDIAAEHHFG